MPKYIYSAYDQKSNLVEGEMEASGEGVVLDYIQKHDLFPVSIQEKKKNKKIGGISIFDSISTMDRIMFARNMALMMRAGISISEAVDIMLDDAQKPALKKILMHVKLQLEKGSQLSDSLSAFPQYFSKIFISLLRSGEASGNMENALMQIAGQLKKENDLRKKIHSAMAYPAILITASFGVMLLLTIVVLPKVSRIFSQSHVELPFITRLLLGFSDFITTQWPLALLIVVLCSGIFYMMKKSESGKLFLNGLARKTPVVNTLIQKIVLARFTSVLCSLLKAGVPIIRALEITSDAVGNALYKRIILRMTKEEIAHGVSFGSALKRVPDYFPRLTTSMIVVGERSGNLENMLDNLSQFYEDQVDDTLKTLVTVLEPALLLGVGLMVGTLALSIIIPIYQLIQTVR